MTRPAGCPPSHPRNGPRWDYAKAIRMHDDGHSHAEIAEACDVSKAAVSAMLVKSGRVTRACMLKSRMAG